MNPAINGRPPAPDRASGGQDCKTLGQDCSTDSSLQAEFQTRLSSIPPLPEGEEFKRPFWVARALKSAVLQVNGTAPKKFSELDMLPVWPVINRYSLEAGCDPEDLIEAVADLWERIRIGNGELKSIADAVEAVKRGPLPSLPETFYSPTPRSRMDTRFTLALAKKLETGTHTPFGLSYSFFLSAETLSKYLPGGGDRKRAGRILKGLCMSGLLKIKSASDKVHAREFRLTEEAHDLFRDRTAPPQKPKPEPVAVIDEPPAFKRHPAHKMTQEEMAEFVREMGDANEDS